MPLRDGECPLGKFRHILFGGGYDKDPIETCFGNPEWGIPGCNFSRYQEVFNLEEICQCPTEINLEGYKKLKKEYKESTPEENRTAEGFQEFVRLNYNSKH